MAALFFYPKGGFIIDFSYRRKAQCGTGIRKSFENQRTKTGWLPGISGQRGDLVCGTSGHHELPGKI